MPSETWRPVVGYEGLYEVSSLGQVRSLPRRNTAGVILKPLRHTGGYVRVMLWRNGRPWQTFAHRLVAAAFLGEAPASYQVAHANGDRQDNRVENLRWATPAENQADRELHGTGRVGRSYTRGGKKLGFERAQEIRALCAALGGNKTQTARQMGLSRTTVADVVNGRTWRPDSFVPSVAISASLVSNAQHRDSG